jgi:PBSX family phage terminase large subunit
MIKLNDKYKTLFQEPKEIRYYIITGGRGSGKSFGVTIWANLKALQSKAKVLFTRFTLVSAEISIIPEFTEKIEMLNLEGRFKVNKTVIQGDTGGEILFKGIKTSSGTQTANLKSLSCVNNWILDEAEELHDEKVFDKIDLSIRAKNTRNNVILILNPTLKEHWIYKRFFEDAGVAEGFNGVKDNVCYIHSTYLDNLDNLSDSFLVNVENIKRSNPTKYQNEILGGWLDAYEGVLFAKETLKLCSTVDTSKIEQILAYVDVATSRGGDYHCAVVGGIIDKKMYILDVVYTKAEAKVNAQMTAALLNKWKPEFCRVESNGAGALYSSLLEPLIETTQLLNVHTTANKQTRLFQTSGWIKDNCVFYSNSVINSDYHLFFRGFTTYLMDGSSPNDDAPDAVWGLSIMARSFYGESFVVE